MAFCLLSCSFGTFLCGGLLGDFHYFFAVVVTAFGAHAVRHSHLMALGALDEAGSGEFPVGAALVATGFGHFTLWYCHGPYPPP